MKTFFVTAGALLLLAAGCGQNNAAKTSPPISRVERDTPARPTEAERKTGFDRAYGEGIVRAQRGEFAEALGSFEQALALQPNSVDATIAIGACHESIGDPIEAVHWYRRALTLNPLDPDAYANLGTAYVKLYHRERNATWRRMALDAWRQSLALKPDQPDVRGYLNRLASTAE